MLSSCKVLSATDFDPSIWAALALAVLLALPLWFSRLHYRALAEIKPPDAGRAPASQPDCMVVIPARNEEGQIGRAVRSLPPDTVIVVDDFSEDKTAAEAREAGAGVLPAPQPLSGELGKPNACMEGARVLTSRWILFADADTHYQPSFLQAIVSAAEARRVDFLSIYLQPEYHGLGASILAPFAVALYFCGINPRRDPAAAFNGQCVLVRRDPYEFVGGHKSLLTSVCDDIKMAALAQRHRLRFAVALAPLLGHVRIRPDDFERNARRFALIGFSKGAPIMLAALGFALWLPVLAWLLVAEQWAAAAVFFFLPSVFLGSWYGWKRAILAPLGIYGMLPILFRGMLGALTHRHLEWKGRVI
jgi:glycosyltransferase involved in cell wall biosynthesis